MNTKEDLLTELQVLSKERAEIMRKEKIIKAQLIPYAKFQVGQKVHWPLDQNQILQTIVDWVGVTNKGKFYYSVNVLYKNHTTVFYSNIPELQISI